MSQREYPIRPILGVAGVVFQGDAVLLARRAQEPALGEWSLPGGVVELGETLEEALKREVLEEVSVRMAVGGLVHLAERIELDPEERVQYHYVIADFWGWVTGGVPRASSDVSETLVLPLDRLEGMPLHEELLRVIHRGITLRREDAERGPLGSGATVTR